MADSDGSALPPSFTAVTVKLYLVLAVKPPMVAEVSTTLVLDPVDPDGVQLTLYLSEGESPLTAVHSSVMELMVGFELFVG